MIGAAGLALALLAPASPADCAALEAEHAEAALALPYEAFDQTEGSGFRVLAAAGCPREAAELVEAYIARHGSSERSLRWHAAQLRATAGENEAAIEHARAVLSPDDEDAARPFRWNDYVRATIAFLEGDRDALKRHRDAVAAGASAHAGNAMNLKLLDALIAQPDRDYAAATARLGR